MKTMKNLLYLSSMMLAIMLTSCKKDEPYVKPKLSFSETTKTVKESDGEVGITLKLDKAADKDVTISYTLSGTATEASTVDDKTPSDYEDLSEGSIVLKKGETTADIQLKFYSDFYFENNQTVIITLKTNTEIDLSTASALTITLAQEDGKVIELDWDYDDVDMDLVLWIGDDANSLDIYAGSAYRETDYGTSTPYEQIFVPSSIDNASFGLSYIYYSGTQTPMDFSVIFVDFKDGKGEDKSTWDTFTGSYTTDNVNPWGTLDDLTHVEQTFDNVNGATANISSPIDIPPTGSRVRTYHAVNPNAKIQRNITSQSLRLLH